ncbi:MAG: DUF1592 domain-containing protein [Acidobacteriota bacterium]|nr:DUF1592 domain-containing protein [Acidobacteriota bacterium]
MKQNRIAVATLPFVLLVPAVGSQETTETAGFFEGVAPLVDRSCIRCHGNRTATPLSITRLSHDLTDARTFRTWQRIHDRIANGEMPPPEAPKPEAELISAALESLKGALAEANLAARGDQRVPLRRLTRLEYAYTIQDLLAIDEAVAMELSQSLPAEADSGGFDTVAANQSMSPLHVRSYLEVADRALDAAIKIGPRPVTGRREIAYADSTYLTYMSKAEILGGGITKMLDDAAVMFVDGGSTYLMHSETEGYNVPYAGRYRATIEGWAYQPRGPVTLTVYRGSKQAAAASLDELIASWDLVGETPRTVQFETFLRPGDLLAPSLAEADPPPGEYFDYYSPDRNVENYKGEGIALRSLVIEGPLFEDWPPPSTRKLLAGVDFDDAGDVVLTKAPYEHVVDVVAGFGPRAFRRPLAEGELKAYASLAQPLLENGRPFIEAVRIPLRAMLSAPPFLFQTGDPGRLDDHALASRLSYFLWRSLPDDELLASAGDGSLSDPGVLASQVERLLDDPRSERFVHDFAGQAFRLYEMKATNPDSGLYPEYDDRLGQAMARETQLFLAELIDGDHGVGSLIDADFTFLNRRLADHYGIPEVEGQHMRKVTLPPDSVRGGLITQASIHKITANGTITSPIPRGNFVLANLLGQPAPPPPESVEALEPDTRGAVTIREQLAKHRNEPVCNSCHRVIDPPGFALESFDVIGGFRTRYRAAGGEGTTPDGFVYPMPYKQGPPVDASGVTADGEAFAGIAEYKELLGRDVEQVARHLVSRLLVYSTGAEIEFADRDGVEDVVAKLSDDEYPFRTMIHEVTKSDLFRTR